MSLTVCCLTADPPGQVAEVLRLVRQMADEILVVVDDRVPIGSLGAYDGVVDRLVRYRFAPPVDRPRPWMLSQCRSEWILSLDGDEVPSPELIDALPALMSDRNVAQYLFPRRWLFPNSAGWLAELPWWPDFQVRLVRRQPQLTVSQLVHDGIHEVLPAAHVDLPLYHLQCLFSSEVERREKVAAYDRDDPRGDAFGGGPLNTTMYLPEQFAVDPPQPTPPTHRALIDAVVAGRQRPPAGAPASGPLAAVTEPELAAARLRTELTPSDYQARLAPFAERGRFAPGEYRPTYLTVTNLGSATWPWGQHRPPLIRLAYHWRTTDGRMLVADGHRSPLGCSVAPGATALVRAWVEAPVEPGRYVLELDLVHEHVRWFDCPLRLEVEVAERTGRQPRQGDRSC